MRRQNIMTISKLASHEKFYAPGKIDKFVKHPYFTGEAYKFVHLYPTQSLLIFSIKYNTLQNVPGNIELKLMGEMILERKRNISYLTSRVSCQKGPTRHAYAWQIGPFWQDTLDIKQHRERRWLLAE